MGEIREILIFKQETAEDGTAGLLQFNPENQQGQGQSYHRNQ